MAKRKLPESFKKNQFTKGGKRAGVAKPKAAPKKAAAKRGAQAMILPVLYHWAWQERRESILKSGLQVYSEPCQSSGENEVNGTVIAGWPNLCFSTRASRAWGLSGDMQTDDNGEPLHDWDLWEVKIPDGAEVHIREMWGGEIEEVRIYTSIPAHCVWLVGQRVMLVAKEIPNPNARR